MITNFWIFYLLVFGILFYFYIKRKFDYWKNLGVPQIAPTAFIGNISDFLIKKSFAEVLKDLYEKSSGPYVGFYVLTKPFLLIREPKLIKRILVKDFNCFNDRFLSAGSHDSIARSTLFLIRNPQWKSLRRNLTPIYSSGKVRKLFELIENVGDDLVKLMDSEGFKGRTEVDVKELSARYVSEAIATTAFGVKANCVNDPTAEFYEVGRDMFENTFMHSVKFVALLLAGEFFEPLKMKVLPTKTANFLRNLLWKVIEDRERSGFLRGDLVDTLIEMRNNKNEIFGKDFDFDGDAVVAQAAVFFIAGLETSSTFLSFSLYEIAVHPEVQDRLRAEIVEGLTETQGKVTYELASNLGYLDMVIAEVLRKYPAVPEIDRVAKEDYKIPDSNFILKKGTPVVIPLIGLHYDPEYFPNPETFDPERFSEVNKKSILPYSYLPFGSGPHNCIGGRIGLVLIKIALIKLLSRYEFSACEKTLIPMRLSRKALLVAADGEVFLKIKKLPFS